LLKRAQPVSLGSRTEGDDVHHLRRPGEANVRILERAGMCQQAGDREWMRGLHQQRTTGNP
jgi:hypothetical protein